MTTVKKKKRFGEVVAKGLAGIPDALILENRKESDIGLSTLIEEYQELSGKSSHYPELTEDMTGYDFKVLIEGLSFEEKFLLVYHYLSGSGKIDADYHLDKDMKTFKQKFIKIGSVVVFVIFVAMVTAILTMAAIRNSIDANNVFSGLLDFVRYMANLLVFGKPVSD